MVNYQNGKVYKIEPICDHEENEIYIGSTTKTYLSQRMDSHRSLFKRWKIDKKNYTTSFKLFEKYGIENCQILLLEIHPCNIKEELHSREGFYIRTLKCVNKVIVDRKREEYDILYRSNHKEDIKTSNKNYRVKNLDKIHEFKNKKTQCPCSGSYTHCHQSLHFRTKKHQNYVANNPVDPEVPIDV